MISHVASSSALSTSASATKASSSGELTARHQSWATDAPGAKR